jgi:hypothetical protein
MISWETLIRNPEAAFVGRDNLVKITYAPTAEIIVHQVLKLENKFFFESVVKQTLASGVQLIPTVNWLDGIAFAILRFPETEDIVKELMNGRTHYSSVLYTEIPFQQSFDIRLGNNPVSVPLVKADYSPDLVELVRFLKNFKPESQRSGRVTADAL